MSKRDTMIRVLCKSLGDDYRVTTIDLERVIYRDFGNGFNVEISGVHTTSEKKKATLSQKSPRTITAELWLHRNLSAS